MLSRFISPFLKLMVVIVLQNTNLSSTLSSDHCPVKNKDKGSVTPYNAKGFIEIIQKRENINLKKEYDSIINWLKTNFRKFYKPALDEVKYQAIDTVLNSTAKGADNQIQINTLIELSKKLLDISGQPLGQNDPYALYKQKLKEKYRIGYQTINPLKWYIEDIKGNERSEQETEDNFFKIIDSVGGNNIYIPIIKINLIQAGRADRDKKLKCNYTFKVTYVENPHYIVGDYDEYDKEMKKQPTPPAEKEYKVILTLSPL